MPDPGAVDRNPAGRRRRHGQSDAKGSCARPIFNLRGTLVVGSEIATGTIVGRGGTLIGTQAWTTPGGQEQRTCMAAFVQTPS